MCGFTGISYHDSQKLSHMSRAVKARAIDDEYFFESDNFSLYHAHLKINDLDKDTSQPYITKKSTISFTGEIYNKTGLCDMCGMSADTTEITLLSQLYEIYGIYFIEYLNGEFSIVIYDIQKKHILLFRDRYGTKPLYYKVHEGQLLFSTELGSLIDEKSQLNQRHILNHKIFSFGISPDTLVTGIYVIPAGSGVIYKNDRATSFRYKSYREKEKENDFLSALENAVIRRIPKYQSNIFIGLSGGLDSSIIALFLKKHYWGNIIAYSFARKENTEDINVAKYNAKILGLKHYILDGSSLNNNTIAHEGLVQLADLYSILREKLPGYKNIKVEFGGDGKEELFQSNTNFDISKIQTQYEKYKKYLSIKSIDKTSLNASMLDYNLQMIDKISLRNGIERRMPFLDYELLKFKNYKSYNEDILCELQKKGLKSPQRKYGYNDGIGFNFLEKDINVRADELLSNLKFLYKV